MGMGLYHVLKQSCSFVLDENTIILVLGILVSSFTYKRLEKRQDVAE